MWTHIFFTRYTLVGIKLFFKSRIVESTVTSPYLRIYNMEKKVSFIGFKIQNEIVVHTRKIIN